MVNKFTFKSDSAFSIKLIPLFLEDTATGKIDWGDGTTSTYVYGYSEHSYTNSGTYTVTYATEGATAISSGFLVGNTYLTSVELSDELTGIGDSAFANCTNLKEVRIYADTCVGSGTFANSGLEKVTFGKWKRQATAIEKHSQGAFVGCTNLTKISYYTSDPNLQGTTNSEYFVADSAGTTFIPVNYLATYVYNVITDIPESNYIIVYDMCETNFNHNGLRILSPTSCTISEELDGLYELTLTHPCDRDGTWKALTYFNIIKADGQLFRIYKKSVSLGSGSASITVNAKHIFYDLADRLIYSCDIANMDGQTALNNIFACIHDNNQDGLLEYDFRYYSDVTATSSADCSFAMVSPVACMIGEDNSFINRLGGHLYRDNFYFSICNFREGSSQNAFKIVHGMDMLAVTEDIDVSELVTYLHTEDNYGNLYDVSYTKNAAFFPHIISKGKVFNYNECNIHALGVDMHDYFEQYWTPTISYSVQFANIKNAELYKDFTGLANYNVGDSGTIYSEELGINTTQTIVSREYDVLKQEVTSITLGNFHPSFVRRQRFDNTITRADNLITRVMSPCRGVNVNGETELQELAKQGKLSKYAVYYDISGE